MVNVDNYVFRGVLFHSGLHSCLHSCPDLERHHWSLSGVATAFLPPVSMGVCVCVCVCSDRCTVDQRPGWETGSTMNSCVVSGKAVCISELCSLNSKMAITVFVLFTQLGGEKVIQWVKEHWQLERMIFFFWNFFGFDFFQPNTCWL